MKTIAVALVAALGLASCGSKNYEKTSSGLMYKIKSSTKDSVVKEGNVMKIHFVQKLNDSVLNSSYGKMPAFITIDPSILNMQPTYDPREIFKKLKKGDSVEIVQLVDTLMKKFPGSFPPSFKKGDRLITSFKVEQVYANQEAARTDMDAAQKTEMERVQKENEVLVKSSVEEIEKEIKSKNIDAVKVGEGTYIKVTAPGDGPVADSGKYISVHYTGRLFATGKEFESSKIPGGKPFSFVLGQRSVIPGWDEGLKGLKKGAKATLYIPGTMAYGPQPGPGGKAFESLVFDVEMVDVADKAPAQKPMPNMPPMPQPQQGGN